MCVILARVMVTRVHVIKCSEALHWLNDLLRGLRVAVLLFLSPMGAGVSWFFGQYHNSIFLHSPNTFQRPVKWLLKIFYKN